MEGTEAKKRALMAMELEVVLAPVSDVDQARPFYGTGLGWPEDADLSPCDAFRVIQVTPPGSQCSGGTVRRGHDGTPAREQPGAAIARRRHSHGEVRRVVP